MWIVALWLACASTPATPPTPAPAPAPASVEPPFRLGEVEVQREVGVATVVGVRTGTHEGYDRVVFELSAEALPGYHVAYVDKPQHRCGSGEAVYLPGEAWLEVALTPARMHTDDGAATVEDRSRALDLPNLRALEATCDFEAHVNWVIGVRSPQPFRVFELADPPRIVVDVSHP